MLFLYVLCFFTQIYSLLPRTGPEFDTIHTLDVLDPVGHAFITTSHGSWDKFDGLLVLTSLGFGETPSHPDVGSKQTWLKSNTRSQVSTRALLTIILLSVCVATFMLILPDIQIPMWTLQQAGKKKPEWYVL